MKRLIIFVVFLISIYGFAAITVAEDQPASPEEFYPSMGFKNVGMALQEFENNYNKKLPLPTRIPPLPFTHHFGKFSDSIGDINDRFVLEMLHENKPENHYIIEVRPIQNRMEVLDRFLIDTYTLKDGSEAKYAKFSLKDKILFYYLVFERDGWQYKLSIDARVSDMVTPEIFVQIANSFVAD
ncbi:hypothetical protein [Ornithinibacillus californiensis]|uniref:hypothetical protein n=1 Tax=Ornithinibacillus californiensis TaxID=161536 RepID=UPI00064DAEEF|nr:hypothetical protein [Ornithinibacillus californiensis]